MEKKRPSHKWTSGETNLFSQILADPENNFMVTLKKSALKKASNSEIFDSIIAEFKEGLGNVQYKGKNSKN